ncbi:MAG: lipoprotein [Pseudomonadota bacterium]
MTVSSITRVVTLLALIALLVTGCGRKGDLEVPPARGTIENPDSTDSEEDEEDRPFFLDALIQ